MRERKHISLWPQRSSCCSHLGWVIRPSPKQREIHLSTVSRTAYKLKAFKTHAILPESGHHSIFSPTAGCFNDALSLHFFHTVVFRALINTKEHVLFSTTAFFLSVILLQTRVLFLQEPNHYWSEKISKKPVHWKKYSTVRVLETPRRTNSS